MRVFLAGGTGFVGGHLRQALLAAGHSIRLLVHGRPDGTEDGVEPVRGDVTRLESYQEAMAGCHAAINLVGIIREFPGRGVTFERLHVQASRSMVLGAAKAGIPRYLHMSALGSRPDAVSEYHRSKWRAEEVVRQSGLRYTIFRPSIIFGPKDDFINRLAGYVRSYPVIPVFGDGSYRLQPIAADDVAHCFVAALEREDLAGRAFELCGADAVSYLELLAMVAECLGRRPRTIPLPLASVKGIVRLLQAVPAFPVTMDQLQMLVEGSTCAGTWRQDFGFQPIGLRAGIKGYLHP
jgi:NADH dehydrogenase